MMDATEGWIKVTKLDADGKPTGEQFELLTAITYQLFDGANPLTDITCVGSEDGQPIWRCEHQGRTWEYRGPMITRNGVVDPSIRFTELSAAEAVRPLRSDAWDALKRGAETGPDQVQ